MSFVCLSQEKAALMYKLVFHGTFSLGALRPLPALQCEIPHGNEISFTVMMESEIPWVLLLLLPITTSQEARTIFAFVSGFFFHYDPILRICMQLKKGVFLHSK